MDSTLPPKISIVTTNFNGGQFLERCIESVVSQGYPNLEYIVIDANSTDGSLDIIRKYQQHISFWTSEEDSGMYDGLQKGFSRSTGEIMGWLNSDDELQPGSLSRLAMVFSQYPAVNWITGVPSAMDEAGNLFIPFHHDYPVWSKIRFYSMDYKWIQQESTFWTRTLWLAAGGSLNISLKYAGDFELWLRFFRHERLYSVPFLVGSFRMRRAGQKSVKFYKEYLSEARSVALAELMRIPFYNWILIPFSYIDRVLISIPGVKALYSKTGFRRVLGYPARFVFNSRAQKFELK